MIKRETVRSVIGNGNNDVVLRALKHNDRVNNQTIINQQKQIEELIQRVRALENEAQRT